MDADEPTESQKKIAIKRLLTEAVNKQVVSLIQAQHQVVEQTGASADRVVIQTVIPKVPYKDVGRVVDNWITWPDKPKDQRHRLHTLHELVTSKDDLKVDDIKGTSTYSDLRDSLLTLATGAIRKANPQAEQDEPGRTPYERAFDKFSGKGI